MSREYTFGEPRTERAEDILRWAEGYGYKTELHGRDIQVIILGEHHSTVEHAESQVQLVRLTKPGIILDEAFKGGYYDPAYDELTDDRKRFFERTSVEQKNIRRILDIAHELGIYVLGCDLRGAELGKKMQSWTSKTTNDLVRIVASLLAQGSSDPIEEADLTHTLSLTESGIRARDEHMIERILEEVAQSSQPIIVIIGARHAQGIHRLRLLQNRGIGYAIVDQTEKKKS